MFYSGRGQAYGVTALSARRHARGTLAARVPHGDGHAAEQAGRPLAVGPGGGPHTPRGGAPRSLLSSAPRPGSLRWPWGRGAAPGAARWPSGALSGGGTAGGPGAVPPPAPRRAAGRPPG